MLDTSSAVADQSGLTSTSTRTIIIQAAKRRHSSLACFDPLFEYLSGARQNRCRHSKPERLGGLEVDAKRILVRRLHG
jgi:hypothetical protein